MPDCSFFLKMENRKEKETQARIKLFDVYDKRYFKGSRNWRNLTRISKLELIETYRFLSKRSNNLFERGVTKCGNCKGRLNKNEQQGNAVIKPDKFIKVRLRVNIRLVSSYDFVSSTPESVEFCVEFCTETNCSSPYNGITT